MNPISQGLPVLALAKDGCTTACMVITPLGSSPNGILHCATVLLFSKIFPALINFTSFAAFGAIFLSDKKQNLSNYTHGKHAKNAGTKQSRAFMIKLCINEYKTSL